MQTSNCNSLLILNKPIFAGEISDTLFRSTEGRESTWLGDPWKTPKGKWSTWYIWKDTCLRLIRCRNIKTKKIKKKLQEINLLGSLFCHKDIPVNVNTPLGCSTSCLRLWILYKIIKTHQLNSYWEQIKARETALQSSPSLLLQHVDFWLLMKNNK